VASDLRAMIEVRFTAQGIAIPYPQRDVHLDATTPLPVRIVPDEESQVHPAPAAQPVP
jgi:potassium efflux system protein